tara:strand:+ start:155 stop:1015 length:861 start_codon:yes stop_codon:yes gene_type:complete
MKLGLGTAQFNNDYGLLSNKLKLSDIKKILNNIDNKIEYIDTAPSYNSAEKLVGKFLSNKTKIKINTKISPFKSIYLDKNISNFEREFEKSLKNLNRDKIYSLMFHSDKDLKKKNIEKFIFLLESLRKNKIIHKYGLSAYELSDIEYACKNFNFRIFQIPINLFNLNNILFKKFLRLKSKYKLELHGRSIFLQGLMTNREKKLPKKFDKIKKNRASLFNEAKLNNLNPSHLIMNKIDNLNLIDVAIIGIENMENYKETIAYKKRDLKKNNTNYYIHDKRITDPRRW